MKFEISNQLDIVIKASPEADKNESMFLMMGKRVGIDKKHQHKLQKIVIDMINEMEHDKDRFIIFSTREHNCHYT